ncbi:MAG: ribosomal-protein-alanine N-acetyltransferase [Candidatus Krumholzibacteriia bacterium]|jgi:ribosomal-protein-alanine N-acetyltransferase
MNEEQHLVRLATAADLPAVIDLEIRCFSDPWSTDSLRAELTCDDLRLPLVIETNGQLSGYLMAWRVVDQLHILNLATDPTLRRQGLASKLLKRAAQEALAWGIEDFTLEVRRSNKAAIGFYQKHGFREVGIRPRYYADNGEDALVMSSTCVARPDQE